MFHSWQFVLANKLLAKTFPTPEGLVLTSCNKDGHLSAYQERSDRYGLTCNTAKSKIPKGISGYNNIVRKLPQKFSNEAEFFQSGT